MRKQLFTFMMLGLLSLAAFTQNDTLPKDNQVKTDYVKQFLRKDKSIVLPPNGTWFNVLKEPDLHTLDKRLVILNFFSPSEISAYESLRKISELSVNYPQVEPLSILISEDSILCKEEYVRNFIRHYQIDHPLYVVSSREGLKHINFADFPAASIILGGGDLSFTESGPMSLERLANLTDSFTTAKVSKPLFSITRAQISQRNLNLPRPVLKSPRQILGVPQLDGLFVADSGNDRILLISDGGSIVASYGSGIRGFRDGLNRQARFNFPTGMVYDAANKYLYVSDTYNHVIRRIDIRSNEVITILGTGEQAIQFTKEAIGTTARISYPTELNLRAGKLFIAMSGFNQIWEMDLRSGKAKPIAGSGKTGVKDGPGLDNEMTNLRNMAFSSSGKIVFTESVTGLIREWELNKGVHTLFDNQNKDLLQPAGICAVGEQFYFCDRLGNSIFQFDGKDVLKLVEGVNEEAQQGRFGKAGLRQPFGITALNNKLYVLEQGSDVIRVINLKKKRITNYQWNDLTELPHYEQAIIKGRKIFTPEVTLGSGENTIVIEINIGDYEIVSFGLNDAYLEDSQGFNSLTLNNPAGLRLEITSRGDYENLLARCELYLTFTDPSKPGSLYYESALVLTPLGYNESGDNRHVVTLDLGANYR